MNPFKILKPHVVEFDDGSYAVRVIGSLYAGFKFKYVSRCNDGLIVSSTPYRFSIEGEAWKCLDEFKASKKKQVNKVKRVL